MSDGDDNDKKPGLRRSLNGDIEASDTGGDVGDPSAHTSQWLALELGRQGGYESETDERQQRLEHSNDEDGQGADSDSNARKDDTSERSVPKVVWDRLSMKERKKVIQAKKREDKQGEQRDAWAPAVKEAIKGVRSEHEEAKKFEVDDRSTMTKDELAKAVDKAK